MDHDREDKPNSVSSYMYHNEKLLKGGDIGDYIGEYYKLFSGILGV